MGGAQGPYQPQQQQGQYGQSPLQTPPTLQQQPSSGQSGSQGYGQAPPVAPVSYNPLVVAPNYVEQQMLIAAEDASLADIFSHRKRIVNSVGQIYEKAFGSAPSRQQLDVLRARLDDVLPLTTTGVLETVIDWLVGVMDVSPPTSRLVEVPHGPPAM